jgi:hypothetical protein
MKVSYLDDIERHGFAVFEDFVDSETLEHLLQELAIARIDKCLTRSPRNTQVWPVGHVSDSLLETTAGNSHLPSQKRWRYGNETPSSSLITCRG